ncbi:MAG: hypothetical protein AELANPGJ_02636 [Anaerolineae bacterium]|nr:hypothetical protein [Anaerolineae bacterium]
MTKSKEQIKAKLNEVRAYFERVLEAVGDRWETQVYSDGLKWNVRQVLIHVADADRGHNRQAMGYAAGEKVIPDDFDVQRYNTRTTEKYGNKPAEQAWAELRESRVALLAWLESVDEDKLDLEGRHASGPIMPVRNMLRLLALHEQAHAQDIAKALGIEV